MPKDDYLIKGESHQFRISNGDLETQIEYIKYLQRLKLFKESLLEIESTKKKTKLPAVFIKYEGTKYK